MNLCHTVKRPMPAQLEGQATAFVVLTIIGMSKYALFLPLLLSAACGGSTPPAESAKPTESETEPKEEKASTDAKSRDNDEDPVKADDKKPDTKSSDTKATDAPKLTRSAQDIITAPDVVFMFSFNDSDVKQAAETKCTAASGNDPKKMNTCLAKARKVIDVDGYRFKEKDGKWWWLTLRTQGKVIHTLHKFEIDFGPEKDGSITIKPKGKDLGSAPGRTPASVVISVPNEYQISLNDPKLGKLVYEAKIGIASE